MQSVGFQATCPGEGGVAVEGLNFKVQGLVSGIGVQDFEFWA